MSLTIDDKIDNYTHNKVLYKNTIQEQAMHKFWFYTHNDIEYENKYFFLLNNFLSLSCLVACKTAPDVYPTKSPSLHAISLEQIALSLSLTFSNKSIVSKWVVDGTKFFPIPSILYGYISLLSILPVS